MLPPNTCPGCHNDTSWSSTSTDELCVACLESDRDEFKAQLAERDAEIKRLRGSLQSQAERYDDYIAERDKDVGRLRALCKEAAETISYLCDQAHVGNDDNVTLRILNRLNDENERGEGA
jgi:hypothetical protein